MYKRQLAAELKNSAKYYPIVSVTGPRQSGKTTLIQNIFPKYKYVSLEDPDNLEFAETDPKEFLHTYGTQVIFDEVQRTPQLFSYLQTIVDKNNKLGQFILSGSQQFLLNAKISQTLAGRTAILKLLPFSLAELMERRPQTLWNSNKITKIQQPQFSVYDILFKGMYPRVYDHNIPAEKFYRDYIDTYVTRDVRTLLNVGDLKQFKTFLRLLAARCGQRVNLTSLGNDAGIDHTTVKRWLSVLEASYIIFLIQPHFNNFNKKLIKTPKIYFFDTGLLCSLLRITNVEELRHHALIGGIFESFVFSELYKYFSHNNNEAPLYFWQDKTGNEIDFLMEFATRVLPIEVKSAKTITQDFFKNINYWLALPGNKEQNGYLVYGGNEWQQRSNTTILPWYGIS